ncbi:nitroreductase [Candidatus Methanoplasma termitum]|uniref:Nitroreductase n=1 Tax=Candidatus Methanoplasma termitum TaxID=1577791 RepID=A0A0A7LH00_9ARCH|nr:nitroreductase family protein [Candidatus Methanoplasma termitum]AIZ56791.1 nitroreductase [Candidatus Methanoplasma termitum]
MTDYPNDTIRSIMERRSVRKYKPRQVTDKELKVIIDCGLNAPSAMNAQDWHFTVIQNAELIDWMNTKIKENLPKESVSRYKDRNGGREDFSMFYDAPTVVLISGDAKDIWTESNCGYAVQNMCLAAQSLGVSSIIIGMARLIFTTSKADEYAKELGVPDGYRPLYAVCFGYGDMRPEAPARIGGRVSYIR